MTSTTLIFIWDHLVSQNYFSSFDFNFLKFNFVSHFDLDFWKKNWTVGAVYNLSRPYSLSVGAAYNLSRPYSALRYISDRRCGHPLSVGRNLLWTPSGCPIPRRLGFPRYEGTEDGEDRRLPTRLRRPAPSLCLSARPDPERRQHRLRQSGGTEGAGDLPALIVPLPPRGGPSGPPPTPSPREYPRPHPHFPTSSFSLEVDLTHWFRVDSIQLQCIAMVFVASKVEL